MADHAHSDGHDSHGHGDAHGHGPSGVGKYVLVFIALLILTGISFAVGNSQTLRENVLLGRADDEAAEAVSPPASHMPNMEQMTTQSLMPPWERKSYHSSFTRSSISWRT